MLFFPDCSTVIRGAPRFVAGALKCAQACCRGPQACRRRSQLLRRPAGMHSKGLILSWNCCIWLYTPHPLRHSWRLPATKMHFADVNQQERDIYVIVLTDKMHFNLEFVIRMIEFEAQWVAFCILGLRRTFPKCVMHVEYPKTNLVSHRSESNQHIGSGADFICDTSEWLYFCNVKAISTYEQSHSH